MRILSRTLFILFVASLGAGIATHAAAQVCPASSDRKALLAYAIDWQNNAPCAVSANQRVHDTLTKYQFANADIIEEHESTLSNDPSINIAWLRTNISGRSVALFHSHGNIWGELTAAYYASASARNTAYEALIAGAFDSDDLGRDTYTYAGQTAYIIWYTTEGIIDHLRTMSSHALIYGDYSYSLAGDDLWNAEVFVGYNVSPSAEVCINREKFWSRIGCYSWPFIHRTVDDAVKSLPAFPWVDPLTNLNYAGPGDWVLDCSRSCLDLAAIFSNVVAFQDTIPGAVTFGFQSYDEQRSVAHTVRGFATASAYPDSCDTLAVVTPSGGAGVHKQYDVSVADDYALYDVVEIDSLGWSTLAAPVIVTEKPAVWDSLVGRSWQDSVFTGVTATDTIYRWDEGSWVIGWPLPAAKAEPRAQSGGSCNYCADYILLTSTGNEALLWPPFDSLTALGYDCELWIGSVNILGSARSYLAETVTFNWQWNNGCAPSCEHVYPVEPGPTLVVVGDETPLILRPWLFENPSCGNDGQGYNGCRSYILTADYTFDGIPDAPVEVLPVSTATESERLTKAGADVTAGRNLDPNRHVFFVGGDLYGGVNSPWIKTFLEETAVQADVHGLISRAIILQSEFPLDDNNAALQTATRDAINAGVLEGWVIGLETNSEMWPSWCIATISDPANLTTKQRAVVWGPGCWLGAVWRVGGWGETPTLEKLAFNDTTKTMVAGGVFNLDRGYDEKHFAWAEILRDARMNALPGQPVSLIHYNAVQAWFDQFPGDTYVLSTFALGCRVIPSDIATDVAPGGGEPTATTAALSVVSNVGTAPRFRFSLPLAENVSLRIVDTSGRTVTILRSGGLSAGPHQYTWLGMDSNGEQVASGVYFGVLSTPSGGREVAKVIIVR